MRIALLLSLLLALVLLAPPLPASPGGRAPSPARRQVGAATVDWPLFGQNAAADRLAPIPAASPAALQGLRLAFSLPLGPEGAPDECFLLEAGGVLYATGPGDRVFAVSAGTGRIVWSYQPQALHQPAWAPVATRGVALGEGLVFLLTADDHLVALDAATGRLRWRTAVADPASGVYETMAPLYAGGRVVVGSAGGDEGNRGFVASFDARSGRALWRFWTVPARGTLWVPRSGHHGGGAVWTTPTWDAASHLILVPVGNPSPDYFGQGRPGPDPYTDSVAALDAATGRLAWYRQEVPHDLWDYDVASPPLLFTGPLGPEVAEAGKDGYLYAWRAATGAVAFRPVAFVREDHAPPTPQGVIEWPGSLGGANYGPSAYDGRLGLLFVAGINGPTEVYAARSLQPAAPLDFGTRGQSPSRSHWSGTITAFDAATGRIRWQVPTATPPIGGVTATSGGLLVFGQESGRLTVLDARSGAELEKITAPGPIAAAPIVYERRGVIYVAVVTGGALSLTASFPSHAPPELLVYRLAVTPAAAR